MIDLADIVKRIIHARLIEHGTLHVLDIGNRAGRRTNVENAHFSTIDSKRRYEVLSDKAGTAGDKYSSHECGSGPT
jgi:hypothetical protein